MNTEHTLNEKILSESDIINQYKLGKLTDIFIAENCFYMPIRITGTGETLRVADDKNSPFDYIIEDRTKHLFFTKSIIEQCGRLPILLEHPKNQKMVSYRNPSSLGQIVGQTIHSYVKGDEIWAIGRIYDLNIISLINNKIFSTSPGVISNCVIIEGNLSRETPIEVNHIAFVKRGHWDQKSPIAYQGDNISIKEDILEDLLIVNNNDVKRVVIQQERQDSDVVEIPNADEEVLVTHKVEPIDDTEVIDEDLPIIEQSDDEDEIVEEVVETADDDDFTETTDEDIDVIETTDDEEDVEIAETTDEEADVHLEEEVVETEDDEDVDVEIIESGEVTSDDKARDKLIDSLNEICDSAHTSLNVKMPYIKGRETTLSIANRFINLNKHLVDKKYRNIVNGRLDNMNAELCKDFISSIKSKVITMSASRGKNVSGFVETRKGYKVDSSF